MPKYADPDLPLFKAVDFATNAHKGQVRKTNGTPYIFHPMSVAKILIGYDCPPYMIIAGLLHDTVEDTQTTLEDIRKNFGYDVARIVEGVSEPDKSKSWEERKEHTIERIGTSPTDVLIVECADKLDNAKSIQADYWKHGDKIWSAFKRPKEKQKWYYQSLAQAFLKRIDGEPSYSLFTEFANEVRNLFG